MTNTLTPKQRSAVKRVKRSQDLQPFLFRKAVGLRWFSAFKEAGFLHPTEIPRPVPAREEGYVSIPVWPITDYLVGTSTELADSGNEQHAVEFIQFIRDATQHARENQYGNYRVWWQFSKIIRNIPPRLIHPDDIDLIDYWLSDVYERGLVAESLGEHWLISLLDVGDAHCKDLAVQLLEALYRIKFVDREYGNTPRKEPALRFDSWYAKKITQKVACKVGQILGMDATRIFQKRLEAILVEVDNDEWSSIWRSAIEDHEQNHGANDAEDIIIEAYRDSLLAYVDASPETSREYVAELLDSHFETVRRIAIYAIDQRFQCLNTYLGCVITGQYFTNNFRHELWHLLRNHYNEFGPEQRHCVGEVIVGLTKTDEAGKVSEGATAYQRAIWLSAIKGYGDDVARLYRESIDIIGGEPEHPDFPSYMSSRSVVHKSPFSKEELLSLDASDLAKQLDTYLETYKPSQGFDEPGPEGLVEMLRHLVKAEPLRFYNQLHKFSESDLSFVYALIEAYRELWTENAQLPWDEIWHPLLGFCRDIVKQDRFWSPENVEKRGSLVPNRYWVVSGIGSLIEAGTKSDEHAFSEQLQNLAEEVILILLSKEKGEKFEIDSDAVFVAINSPRGHCIRALINLTLRSCRLANKQCGNHAEIWAHFQPNYDSELARAEIGEYEFATFVVNYLPHFLYMSKEWVLVNLDNIFDKDNYQKWLCAMNGYAYVDKVYKRIYKHLKDNDHLIPALDDENIRERVGEKIIWDIAVTYINDFEDLEDKSSLIHQLLLRQNSQELGQLIRFFWWQREDGDKKIRGKVLELWSRLLGVIDTSSREGRQLASKLCVWFVFVDEVNEENKQLLLAIAPFAGEEYNSHDLIESIARISERQPAEAYEIWRRLLEGAKPDFPEEAIRSALTNLVKAGLAGRRMAKNIVSEYLKDGNEQLKWMQEIVDEASP